MRTRHRRCPEELIGFAVQVARGAGDLLLEYQDKLHQLDVQFKGGRSKDLVTQADTRSERMVRQRILARYPDDSLVGEEEASRHGTSGVTWVIDPLDGTTNFVHRIPAFAVSIGVMDGDEVVAGVVHAPVLKETYAAFVGGGSVLNRKPIRVSGVERIPQALVASGFADVRAGMQPNNLSAFSHFVSKAQAVRRMGAASVDLAYVASGRFDAFWEYGLGPWDVCAGTLLITEAGGRVSDADGGGMHLSGKSVVATNGAIHQEVLESLNAFPRPDRGAA